MNSTLFPKQLTLEFLPKAIPARAVLVETNRRKPLKVTYIGRGEHDLVRAARLLKFAERCAKAYRGRDIYTTELVRNMVDLPQTLTAAFFEKKAVR